MKLLTQRVLRISALLIVCLFGFSSFSLAQSPVPSNAPAGFPAWWFEWNVISPTNPTNTSPTWPGDYPASDDYSAINQGMLKNLALGAITELQAQLPSAVLTNSNAAALQNLIAGWTTNPATNADNYAAVNQGQLKYIAKQFYDLLGSGSYTAGIGLQPTNWTGTYPWPASATNADPYSLANIGQAKYVFSFDLTAPAGQVPAWWAQYYFGTTNVSPNSLSPSGDGNTLLQDYLLGNNPKDFYNGVLPTLSIVSGASQTGSAGQLLSAPLVVSVTDASNNPTNDANTNAIAQDVVNIPAQSNTLDTNVVNGWVQITNGTWNIYQDKDWTNAVAQGFFGGDATLSLMISNSNGATILPPQNFYFRIAGENPDTNLCKTYITNNCGPYWYAYAIAKEETEGDGSHHYYNHFMDNGGTLTNHATPWPGHEGRPSWNDDGIPDATTGSGGYGLMQQTYGTNEANYIMPRSWIWNWQANLAGFTNEIYSKEVDYVTNNGIVTNMAIAPRKYNILVGWNPTLATHIWCPAKGATKGAFSSYQTVLIGVYNGNKGFSRVYPNDNLYPKGIKSPWDSQWKLTATYPPKVASKLETNTPSQ